MQTDMNPDGFGPEDDLPHQRPENTPNWTESYAVWAYMEDQYLYMHFQRHPDDSGMWRGYATIMGEDGSVIATHNFGRQFTEFGPGYQQVHCIIEKPYELFHAKVDSMAQISDWATLRQAPLQSLNEKITPLQIDLRFTSISPTYQPMPQDDDRDHSNSKWTHFTPCRVVGYVTIGAERKYVECLGWRDHSAGVRSFESMTDGFMYTGVFPSGKSFMTVGIGTRQEDGGNNFLGIGGVTIDGKTSYATDLMLPDSASTTPEPYAEIGMLVFETEHGRSEIRMRTLNQGVPFALLPPNFESIGLPDGLSTRLFYHEWRLEVEWDGEKGIGGWEPCEYHG